MPPTDCTSRLAFLASSYLAVHSYVARVAYLLYNIAQHGVALKMRSVINDPVKTDMRRMYVPYNYLLRKKSFIIIFVVCCHLAAKSRNFIVNSANEVIGYIINDPAKTNMRRVKFRYCEKVTKYEKNSLF